jgi:hypothetical protein
LIALYFVVQKFGPENSSELLGRILNVVWLSDKNFVGWNALYPERSIADDEHKHRKLRKRQTL